MENKNYTITIEITADDMNTALEETRELFLAAPEDGDGIWRYIKTRTNSLSIEEDE